MRKVLILTQDPLVHLRQTIDGLGMSDDGRYKFYINDIDEKPDFVVVKGKGISENKIVGVPKERTMLVTCEPYGILDYPRGYCDQFGVVLACQPELKVSKNNGTTLLNTPAVLPWFVGAVFLKGGGSKITMTREEIFAKNPQKTKLLSVITSKKAFTKGHVDRLRFVKKLKEYYGDAVDVFGHGFNDFDDKWDVLAPYKYHIVIENSECDYYWTEKLSDCYLAGTYPLYHGCTNIGDYFPHGAYQPVNIRDFESVVNAIENAKKNNLYENSLDLLQEAKQLVLGSYNMFNLIAKGFDAIENLDIEGGTLLKPSSEFFSLHNLYLHTIEWSYYKLLGKYFV